MKKYIGVKLINAVPMTRQAYNDFRGWELPDDENGSDEGYLVEYVNGGDPNTKEYAGYVSWSPSKVFQNAYKETEGLTFGLAIEAAKKGLKIARKGWNGMFAYYVPAGEYDSQCCIAKDAFGPTVPYRHYLALKTAQGDVATWSPSCSDALADDWEIV